MRGCGQRKWPIHVQRQYFLLSCVFFFFFFVSSIRFGHFPLASTIRMDFRLRGQRTSFPITRHNTFRPVYTVQRPVLVAFSSRSVLAMPCLADWASLHTLHISLAMRRPYNVLASFLRIPFHCTFYVYSADVSSFVFHFLACSAAICFDAIVGGLVLSHIFRCSTERKNSLNNTDRK